MIEYQNLNRPNWSVDWMTSGILPNQLRSPPSPQPTVRGRAERCDTLQLWKCTSQKKHQENVKKNGAAEGTGMIPEVCKMLISLKNKN